MLLAGFPVVYETDVLWGDMDAFQHVNNVIYFRYFESARAFYFERAGVFREMQASGIGPIVHSQSCRYRFPVTWPDRIQVGVQVGELGEDRFPIRYRLVSSQHQVVAAEGETLVVMYDYARRAKAPIPPGIRAAIAAIEGWEGGG